MKPEERESNSRTVSALFVHKNGIYYNQPHVEPWDIERDATKYNGPHAVVAHPPCARWCRLAAMVEKRYPKYKRHQDGGTFASALAILRRFGGVLEHPAWSDAWPHFGLPTPNSTGGWQRGICGGWSAHVEQIRYGHQAKKATWLYAFGVDYLPALKWGSDPDCVPSATVSWCGNKVKREAGRKRLTTKEASATPIEFRDVLISIARSVRK